MLYFYPRSVNRQKNSKIYHGNSEKIAANCKKTPKLQNFKCPYLPQMGADSPRTKIVFVRVPWAIMSIGQIGGPSPGSGKPPKVPQSKIDKLRVQKRITCKEETCQFSFTVTKYYPRSMTFVGWWTFWGRVWGPQSNEMGSKCQFWKFQTPISPLNGCRFPRNKDHFSQGP